MALRVVFKIDWWRMVAFQKSRFSPGLNGVRVPTYRGVGIRHTSSFLDPTRLIYLGGVARMRICWLRKIPRRRGNLRSRGDSA